MASTADELKAKFKIYDKNKDGKLDVKEMCALLKKGNPNMKDVEIRGLFAKVDKSGDGFVDFDEFVEYIYGATKGGTCRSSVGRHEALAADTASAGDDTEGDWSAVESVFAAFAGKDAVVDGKEFSKLCDQCKLFDRKFTKNDVDIVFAKIVTRGQRKIGLEQFRTGMRQIASKKGCPVADVQAAVGASSGPVLNGTKADDVRFHDDKSTYTGAHTANAHHDGAGGEHRSMAARHSVIAAKDGVADQGHEADWADAIRTFDAYAGADKNFVGKEFAKMCADCGLFGGRFKAPDADIVFSSVVTKGSRAINEEQFKDCLRKVAAKKGCEVSEVQEAVAQSLGPQLQGTVTDDVRFHDDTSTYTGAHKGKNAGGL